MRSRDSRTNYLPYFPNGERALDGAEVLKSSFIEYSGEPFEGEASYLERVYFEDIQAYIEADDYMVKIIDVSNAFKSRQECYCLKLVWNDDPPKLPDRLNAIGVKTMNDLYQLIMVPGNGKRLPRFNPEEGYFEVFGPIYQAYHTYSPFVPIRSIKKPKKWTQRRIWQAIISGQIYRATFHTEDMPGDELELDDMAGLAHNLIVDCSVPKLSIESIDGEGGTAVIKLRRSSRVYDSCPHPEYSELHNKMIRDIVNYTLYFDPDCDRKEACHRWFMRYEENRSAFISQKNPWLGWQQR